MSNEGKGNEDETKDSAYQTHSNGDKSQVGDQDHICATTNQDLEERDEDFHYISLFLLSPLRV